MIAALASGSSRPASTIASIIGVGLRLVVEAGHPLVGQGDGLAVVALEELGEAAEAQLEDLRVRQARRIGEREDRVDHRDQLDLLAGGRAGRAAVS